jgi:protein SCO1/2
MEKQRCKIIKHNMQNTNKFLLLIALLSGLLNACNFSTQNKLPILGNRVAEEKMIDGKLVVDTIYQTVPKFSLLNQDSVVVNNETVKGKIYVADFFFTSCPTICPVMKKEMIRVYEKFKGNNQVLILSHTIDPDYDTIQLLRDYANRLGSDGKQWMFLRGDRKLVYELAEKGYYASAMVDSSEPGGFIHSGGFILVDRFQRVRGIYDGTSTNDVDKLMSDMELLLKEE